MRLVLSAWLPKASLEAWTSWLALAWANIIPILCTILSSSISLFSKTCQQTSSTFAPSHLSSPDESATHMNPFRSVSWITSLSSKSNRWDAMLLPRAAIPLSRPRLCTLSGTLSSLFLIPLLSHITQVEYLPHARRCSRHKKNGNSPEALLDPLFKWGKKLEKLKSCVNANFKCHGLVSNLDSLSQSTIYRKLLMLLKIKSITMFRM